MSASEGRGVGLDGGAAQHFAIVVEDDGLAGVMARWGCSKVTRSWPSGWLWMRQGAGLAGFADFGCESGAAFGEVDPVGLAGEQAGVEQGFAGADDEGVGRRVFGNDEGRLAEGTKPLRWPMV
jgi:hypothetical protein